MKNFKKFADGEDSLFFLVNIIILIGLCLSALLGHCQTVQVRTTQELSEALNSKFNVRLMTDSMDLTGVVLPPVESQIYGAGKKVFYKSLPVTGEVFMFNVNGGGIDSLTIVGPNGNVYADGGFFGGVKTYEKGAKLTNLNFINCDKFGIYNLGARVVLTDTTYATGCTFTNIKRNGYGYGIWTQYGASVVRNSVFQQGRHGVDGSSESNFYDIQYCTFTGSFYNYQIHLHSYTNVGGVLYSGNGMVFKNNYIYGKQVPIEVFRSFLNPTVFDNNHFEASADLGKISGVPIVSDSTVWKNNKTGGMGMPVAPTLTGSDTVMVGGRITFSCTGYSTHVFPFGKPSGNGYASPRVRVYTAYGVSKGIRSITATKTLTVRDTGLYTGFYLKTHHAKIEVYRNGSYLQTIQSPTWVMCLFKGGRITFKVIGEVGGVALIDDWVKNGGSETFEVTNKIKVYGYVGTIKTGRFPGDQSSGQYSFKFEFVDGGSVGLE